jgi:uncharacterized protein YegP (UPF0339 family)
MGSFTKYKDTRQQWRWRLQAANNQIIADSGEGYSTEYACDQAIALVRQTAPIAPVRR